MNKKIYIIMVMTILMLVPNVFADRILIPMDYTQNDHLKAYGVAFWCLQQNMPVEWLLNYKDGSFLTPNTAELANLCLLRGVSYNVISQADVDLLYKTIEAENMEDILLEKAPRVAIYTPPNKEPWDDAVTLALAYAEIPYTTLWDEEVLNGQLSEFDWLHLHHEDFTGQYGKFYGSYHNTMWYQQEQTTNEIAAKALGFQKVPQLKLAVAKTLKDFIYNGGFLFAMCSAPETMDIALASEGLDIVPREYDGDPFDPDCQKKLNYDNSLAFENFTISLNAMEYRHSDIDTYPERANYIKNQDMDYFRLFDFSAKLDPVPAMLVQDHVGQVQGFMGQSTAMRKSLLKSHVTILGEVENYDEVRYIHGNYGRGTFTFLSGHDPEDYTHMVGDPPTDLELHKNSPGYRLILNNILFPAAQKKERKT